MAKLTYTGAEVQSLLDKVNGISGGGIAYPLTWSGYSQGMWDGSAPADIVIPTLLGQLTNDIGYIKDVSSDMIEAALGYTPYNSTNPNGYITPSALTPYATTDGVNSLLTDYLPKSGGTVNGAIYFGETETRGENTSGLFRIGKFDENGGLKLQFGDNSSYIGIVNKEWNFGVLSIDAFGNVVAGGNITANSLSVNGTSLYPTGDIAIQFPAGEYIDRWGNIVLPSTASQWSVKNSNMMLLSVRNDGEIRINNTIHFTSEGMMLQMQADAWKQSRVMWHGWDTTEWDSLTIQLPSWDMNNVYFKLRLYLPAVLNTSLQVNGNLLATGEITQHSSLVLKDVIDTRFLTLKELAELRPYNFRWKDGRDDKLHAGAVADYVKPILPEVISTDKDNIHSMNYANAAWVVGTSLTPYVNKHEEEIERLKARVKYLESRLNEC